MISVILYFLFKGVGGGGSSSGGRSSSSSRPGSHSVPNRADPPSGPTIKNAPVSRGYRPTSAGAGSSGISFGTEERAPSVLAKLGEQVTDFVTGAPLKTSPSTYQCLDCLAFYSPESFDLLRTENSGRCASCRSTNLRVLGGQSPRQAAKGTSNRGRETNPGLATLTNFREFEGQVVTFSGQVVKVLESRRGGDFAVMFENKTWKQGFKLVFFKSALRDLGGADFVKNLAGSMITVRGLVVNHQQFGYEIIVNDRAMVLGVER